MSITDQTWRILLASNAYAAFSEKETRLPLIGRPRKSAAGRQLNARQGYQAILNKEALGFEVTAFVHLSVDSHTEEVTRELEEKITLCPEVVALYNVTGDYDFLVKIVCKSIALYTTFIEKTLRKIPCITQIRTSITLREVYDSKIIPLSTYT